MHLAISNLKRMPRLDRTAAVQLQALVRLGRQLMATELALEASREGEPVAFRLAREDQLLLTGCIPRGERDLTLAN